MNNQRIGQIVKEYAGEIDEAELGYWKFSYQDMRVISPVAQTSELDDELIRECMKANFDRALDARYAISGEYLWSAFIHPLTELKDTQLIDALDQVATLAKNFGSSFTSSELLFGGE